MAKEILAGKKVMCFLKEGSAFKSIGFCTSHTFSTQASLTDISHKDLSDAGSGGKWVSEDVDTYSWSITSESFYAAECDGFSVNELFALYANGTPIDVKFGLAPNSPTGVPTDGWTPSTGQMLSGKAIISSLDINASVSEKATFSIVLTGQGPITLA